MNPSDLSPEQQAYYDQIVGRFSSAGFELEHDVPTVDNFVLSRLASDNYSFREDPPDLPPTYLCVAKRLKYSPLSVIGFVEQVFLVSAVKNANAQLVLGFADRARIHSLVRKSKWAKGVFPVLV